MTSAKRIAAITTLGLAVFHALHADISITGTVTDGNGDPVEGVTVALVVEGSSVVTNANGQYSIEKLDTRSLSNSSSGQASIGLRYGRFSVATSRREQVKIEAFDAKGGRVSVIVDAELAAGTHEFHVGERVTNAVLLIRATIGEQTSTFKYALIRNSQSVANAAPTGSALGKALAVVDTLRASKAGYRTQSKPVESYAGTVDFTLMPVSLSRISCFIPETSGDTYYIAPDGNDGGSGSEGSPFKTFGKAVSMLDPGDVLIVKDGTYTATNNGSANCAYSNCLIGLQDVSGTQEQPIVIKAQNWGKAVLDGQKTCKSCSGAHSGIWLLNSNWIVIAGLEVKNNVVGVFMRARPGVDPGPVTNITLAGIILHHSAYWVDCVSSPGGFGFMVDNNSRNVTIANSIIHSNGRLPAEEHCTQAQSDAINGWDHGLYLCGRGHRVFNNIFYNHRGGYHLKLMGYPGAKVNNGPDVVVSNNLFLGPSGRTVGHSIPGKDSRSAFCTWENNAGENNVPIPLIQNNLFVKVEGTMDAVALLSNTASSFWPENYACNNITTAGKFLASTGYGGHLTDQQMAAAWTMESNEFNATDFGFNADTTDIVDGSVAIDAGRNTLAPSTDCYCRERGDVVDVGPFER